MTRQPQSETFTRVPASELNMTSQSGIEISTSTAETGEALGVKNEETTGFLKCLLNRPSVQVSTNMAVDPALMLFRVVIIVLDSSVSKNDATDALKSKWAAQKDPSIVRTQIGGHNCVFVCGPCSRDIKEASLRAHALTKDNGPTISRLFNAN